MTDAFWQMLGWLAGLEAWAAAHCLVGGGVALLAWACVRRPVLRLDGGPPATGPADPRASIHVEDDPEGALNTDEPTARLTPAERRVPYREPRT